MHTCWADHAYLLSWLCNLLGWVCTPARLTMHIHLVDHEHLPGWSYTSVPLIMYIYWVYSCLVDHTAVVVIATRWSDKVHRGHRASQIIFLSTCWSSQLATVTQNLRIQWWVKKAPGGRKRTCIIGHWMTLEPNSKLGASWSSAGMVTCHWRRSWV